MTLDSLLDAAAPIMPFGEPDNASPLPPPADDLADGIAGLDGPDLQPKDVIGPDDRRPVPSTRQLPWQMVCHLVIEDARGRRHTGTGWLAGPSTVLTAGHNLLYQRIGHEAARVWVMPGREPNLAPHGRFECRRFDVHPHWRASEPEHADVGVIWLPEPAGRRLGHFGYTVQPDAVLRRLAVQTSGYPDSRNQPGRQFFVSGTIHDPGPPMLAYALDTTPGQSGSPVFVVDAAGRAVAVGVHVYGARRENYAVRITQPIFDVFAGWHR